MDWNCHRFSQCVEAQILKNHVIKKCQCITLYYLGLTVLCQTVGRLNITLYMVIFIPAVVDREAVNCWVTIRKSYCKEDTGTVAKWVG